jgi:hypothetical protein
MRKIFFTILMGMGAWVNAQMVLNNAVLKIKMETVRDNSGDSEGMQMRIGNSETDIKVYLKDSLSKVELNNNFMNSINVTDRKTGVTTNLIESQGEKTGYTQTPAEREAFRLRMDSIRKAQQEGEGNEPGVVRVRMGGPSNVKNIEYIEEAKVINKINCKKAIVTTANDEGKESKITLWYTTDYALPNGVIIGGAGGRGMMNFKDLKGMPIQYETINTMNFNSNEMTLTTTYEVTEIKLNAILEDKDFAIPKGYKVKTYEEWIKDNPSGRPGGGIIRMRG